MTAAELAESALERPALVFGSLPPHGRDLDLLVRPAEGRALAAALEGAGFVQRGDEWARFADCTVEAVDVVPAGSWRLPAAEVDALFADARPIDGFDRLVRPAPHHALLIAARRAVRDGRLDRKRRARVSAALAEDPTAWTRAAAHAPAWRQTRALAALREAREGSAIPLGARAAALREELGPRAVRVLARRPARGSVISLSGLDGSGKSSQAQALRDALLRQGVDAAVKWTRISHNPSLDAISAPVKRLLRSRTGEGGAGAGGDRAAAKAFRDRNAVVRQAWVTIVAVGIARIQRRATLTHVRNGRTVICDRYTLDAIVQLRHTYGEGRRFGLQVALVRALSPGPRLAFLLDVPPEVALARKAEDYGLDELAAQARLYREVAGPLGAIRLDGTRSREELCAEIARIVWENG